ncbi:MAG: (d)CMP kinase [Clostridia bacterium]
MERINIAIDGPSGSGKSSTAKLVAKELKIIYLDTGAMFRALALKAIRSEIDPLDEASVRQMLENTIVDVKYDDGVMKLFLDGEEVSSKIRENSVSKVASDISSLKIVREKLIGLQREIAKNNDVVLDGRDIGTVVLPNAKYKFFLTANSLERAKRRHAELLLKGENIAVDVILKEIEQRDYNDTNRVNAPLRRADDAILIDTTAHSLEEVVEIIIDKVGG